MLQDLQHKSTSVLKYQHQLKLEQKKSYEIKVSKLTITVEVKTVENMLHLKFIRGVRGVPLAYMVQDHIKVAHITPGYDAYLNLGEEMIARAPIDDGKLNIKLTQCPG